MIDLPRFFLESGQPDGKQVIISKDDSHHITRVLRLRVGDMIECVDLDSITHVVRITELGTRVVGMVEKSLDVTRESPLTLTLFQGIVKGDKMDFIIQKAVELGVSEIVPFSSRYCVVKLDQKQVKTRLARWQRIALEAAKQSGRTLVPQIREPLSFSELTLSVTKRNEQGELIIFAYEGEKQQSINQLHRTPQKIAMIVGPEGGFAPDEVAELSSKGASTITLGPRILRAETAGLTLLSIVGYRWGDLG